MLEQAQDRLKAGDLAGTLEALQNAVRSDPANAKLRIFLFQLLCITGDWTRAITQLKLCAEMDAAAIPMAQAYREAIICEVYREKVFSGEKLPLMLGEPQEWVALMVEALSAQAQGEVAKAAETRARAFEAVPDVIGTLNDQPFEWIADADMRLGPLLEIIVNGKYYWMPFSAIDTMSAEPPEDLRDAVWTAVNLTTVAGGEMVGLVPTRYVGTTLGEDPAAKLARATTWEDAGAETYIGQGQRLLTTDAADVAIMDLRKLQITALTDA